MFNVVHRHFIFDPLVHAPPDISLLLQGLVIIADGVMLIGRLFVGFLVIILNAGIARDCLPPCNNTMKEHCFSTNRHRFTCLFNHIQTH